MSQAEGVGLGCCVEWSGVAECCVVGRRDMGDGYVRCEWEDGGWMMVHD
jgi:hypothetical protein